MSYRRTSTRSFGALLAFACLLQPGSGLAQRGIDPALPDLSAEAAAAERARPALDAYRERLAAARRSNGPLPVTQLSELKAAATATKAEYAALARAAASFMNKLKAAGKWNTDLDKEIERRMLAANISGEFVNYVRSLGGPRAVIEKVSTMAAEASKEVDAEVASLTARGPAQAALEALLGTAVYAACFKCHCLFYAAAAAILAGTPGGQPAAIGAAAAGLACAFS